MASSEAGIFWEASFQGPDRSFGSYRRDERNRIRQSPPGDIEVVQDLDFDSYADMVEWLMNSIYDPKEYGEILDRLAEEELDPSVQPSLNGSATPTSISVRKPFRFKLFQLQFRVTVGDCGRILCRTIGFSLEFVTARAGGAIFIGLNHSRPRNQVCQGGPASATGLLIVTPQIPKDAYTIRYRAIGFGRATTQANITMRVP